MTGRRAVAVGGGTGLPVVLRCLLGLGFETTAVVTMADDGGSSGQLRRELGMLPPGDARNCLVALSRDPDGPIARLLQYRFPLGEGLAGHALGNLVIAALADIEGSFPAALDELARMLDARGRVLPSTLDDVVLAARDVTGGDVVGQVNVAESVAPIECVRFEGATAAAYPPALEALTAADLVVVGPGSLFTSILPNFLVDGVAEALRATAATVVYVCNVANQRGETGGMDAADHVEALLRHGLDGVFDIALVNECDEGAAGEVEPVAGGRAQAERIRARGIEVRLAALVDPADARHHHAPSLARVLAEVTGA